MAAVSEPVSRESTRSPGCETLFDEEEEDDDDYSDEFYYNYYADKKHEAEPQRGGRSIADHAEKKQTAKRASSAGNSIFGCLSRKASIIGLPKPPDTEFKKEDYAARIRSGIVAKYRSGTVFSIIPRDAAEVHEKATSFESCEPTSPNVSCIGRVKLKQKEAMKLKALRNVDGCGKAHGDQYAPPAETKAKRRPSWLKKLFCGNNYELEPSVASDSSYHSKHLYLYDAEVSHDDLPDQLRQLKRLTFSRESSELSNLNFIDDVQTEEFECGSESFFSEEEEYEMEFAEVDEWGYMSDDEESEFDDRSGPLLVEKKMIVDVPLRPMAASVSMDTAYDLKPSIA
eukprot:Gb_32304 [translate_table: standard]